MTGPDSVHLEWIDRHKRHAGDECLRWPFSNEDWYHSVSLGEGCWSKAHRLMCIAVHGEPPSDDAFAIHSCDQKWCVNPNHLNWGTPTENTRQARDRGLILSGERSAKAKLTEAEVIAARADRAQGMTYQQLAEKYGIAKGAIWHAVKGSQWSQVR